MTYKLSQRSQKIKPSPTLTLSAKAQSLKAAGQPVLNLAVGEPDFDTPEHIKAAAIKAIQDGFTKYTAVEGIMPLREAIVQKFKTENNISYHANQVMVSCGGKQVFYNLAQAYLNEGDEVLIPAPYWVSYPDMVLLANATPKVIETSVETAHKLTPALLEAALSPKTKMLVLNSPSNPSGMAYTLAELKALAEVLKKYPDVLVVSDDIYEHSLWSMDFANIVMADPSFQDRTLVLNGVSKTYAMTGWRIGYAAGPTELIQAMGMIQSQSTSNPCSIAQKAALAALTGPQDFLATSRNIFKKRHDTLIQQLNKIPGIHCTPSDGTFYTFPSVEGVLRNHPQLADDLALSNYLLQKALLAVVPGSAFGSPGHLRLSFATSDAVLEESVTRLAEALATIQA